jgi:hypothetical protein
MQVMLLCLVVSSMLEGGDWRLQQGKEEEKEKEKEKGISKHKQTHPSTNQPRPSRLSDRNRLPNGAARGK